MVAVKCLSVNMVFILSHTHELIVLMHGMRKAHYHGKQQAKCQEQAQEFILKSVFHCMQKYKKLGSHITDVKTSENQKIKRG